MALLAFLIFCTFYQALPGSEAAFNDVVFPDSRSRLAAGWVPVAQCRADCFNAFGWNFGQTTLVKCNSVDVCFTCWQDCACNYMKPFPLWYQCSLPSSCYAGCRRALAFYADHPNGTGSLASADNSSAPTWTLLSTAKIYDNVTLAINNTLVDSDGRPYSETGHLIFSVSYYDGRRWIQLTQATNFVETANVALSAPECMNGCRMHAVATNSSAILAESFFSYIASRVVRVPFNYTIKTADDSSLSITLNLLPLSLNSSSSSDSTYQLFWTQKAADSGFQNANISGEFKTLDMNPQSPEVEISSLLYNTVYNATVVHNTPTSSIRYEYQFVTPVCQEPDSEGLFCKDTAYTTRTRTGQSDVQTTAVVIGGTVLTLAVGILFYFLLRRYRRRHNAKEGAETRLMGSVSMSALTERRVVQWIPPPPSDTELINPNFSEIIPGKFSATGHYLVTEGFFKSFHVAVKSLSRCRDDKEKTQCMKGLLAEVAGLTAVRNHTGFVRLLGTAAAKWVPSILTQYEAGSFPLDTFLRKIYRDHKVVGSTEDGVAYLSPGGFGIPGTGFMKRLTGMDMMQMALDVASGLAYLNSRKIIHGSFCANNVLVNADFRTKIHGLSSVSFLAETNRSVQYDGRYNQWMPLEVLRQRAAGVGMKTDVWSFGVFLWEMLTLGSFPYAFKTAEILIQFLAAGRRLEQSPLCSNDVYDFMLSCWNEDISRRPSMLSVHEQLVKAVSRQAFGGMIALDKVAELEELVDVTGSVSSSRAYAADDEEDDIPNDMDDDVFESVNDSVGKFSGVPKSVSQENLVVGGSAKTTPIGSLQRVRNKFGSLRKGSTSSRDRSSI
ncbi:putative Fibroblast growth factor receptor [Hypsibius exemplaris]|uniref:Fibroblast growth factor receptor n=1 Tax=Hypsibius exemplaris TaxID=2072580 RepID=A0A1W0WWM3_HYPEX|nr:putative Fibroblast growth factor receptor [Hypsibius exemplaris]